MESLEGREGEEGSLRGESYSLLDHWPWREPQREPIKWPVFHGAGATVLDTGLMAVLALVQFCTSPWVLLYL